MIAEETHARGQTEDHVPLVGLATGVAGWTRPVEPKRVEASTSTLRGTEEALHTVFGGSDWVAGPDDDSHAFRYLAIGDERVMLGRSRMCGSVRGCITPVTDHVVATVTSGSVTADRGWGPVPVKHGVPKLWSPDQSVRLTGRDPDIHFVRIDAGLLAAAELDPRAAPDRPPAIDGDTNPSADASHRWAATVRVASEALARHGIESDAWRAAVGEIVRMLPVLFPTTPGPLAAVLRPIRSDALRAAVTHLHAHLDRPVTLAELMEVGGISARTVQEGFQRAFGVPPLTYHRRLRLEAVRGDLLDSVASETTVADVARRWGFSHLGRFARKYSEEYGEYPKTSLRR